MKKFLSSLLALTMILSLVIVPANATENGTIESGTFTITNGSTISVKKGDPAVTLGATLTEATLKYQGNTVSDANTTYAWTVTRGDAVTIAAGTNQMTIVKKGDATIQCTATMTGTYTPTVQDGESATTVNVTATKTTSATVTVADPQGDANAAFETAVKNAGFTYNGRDTERSGNTITYYPYDGDNDAKVFAVKGVGSDKKLGSDYTDVSVTFTSGNVTVTGKKGATDVTAEFAAEQGQIGVTIKSSITGKIATDNEKVIKGGTLVLTADVKGVSNPYYE